MQPTISATTPVARQPGRMRVAAARVSDALGRFVFGHDVFVSYARRDALAYAERLANALTERKLFCYLDQWGAPPGEKVPPTIFRQVRRSTVLVVVGSPAALESRAIREEILEFDKTGRPIIPVRVGPDIEGAWWYPEIKGAAIREENPEAFPAQQPSEDLIEMLDRAVGYNRRSRTQRRIFWGTLLVAFAASVWALVAVKSASAATKEASAARKDAGAAASQRDAARGQADSIGKVLVASRAELARLGADLSRVEADYSRVEADLTRVRGDLAESTRALGEVKIALADSARTLNATRANLGVAQRDLRNANVATELARTQQSIAEDSARMAREEAARQRTFNSSLSLAGESSYYITTDPRRGFGLAIQAWGTARTFEARRALLHALDRHPNLMRAADTVPAAVTQLAFYGDSLVAVGTVSGTVHLVAVAVDSPVVDLPSKRAPSPVMGLAFSPDGRLVASGDSTGKIGLWGVAERRILGTQVRDSVGSWQLVFADTALLAAGGATGQIHLWRFPRGGGTLQPDSVRLSPNNKAPVRLLEAHPGRGLLAAVAGDTLYLVDTRSPRGAAPVPAAAAGVRAIRFNDDGSKVVTLDSAGQALALWSYDPAGGGLAEGPIPARSSGTPDRLAGTQAGDHLFAGTSMEPEARAESASGQFLATSHSEGRIYLWRMDGHPAYVRVAHPRGPAQALAFAPAGGVFASAGSDGILRVHSASTGAVIDSLVEGQPSKAVALAMDAAGERVAVGGATAEVVVWDRRTGTRVPVSNVPVPVTSLVFSRDGRMLLGASKRGTAVAWDLAADSVVDVRTGVGTVLDVDADGRTVVAADSAGSRLITWQIGVEGSRTVWNLPEQVAAVSFVAPGRVAVVGTRGGRGAGALTDARARFREEPGRLEAVSATFSGEGELAVLRGKKWMAVYDSTGAVPLIERRSFPRELPVVLAPDGTVLLMGTADGIQQWALDPAAWLRQACAILGGPPLCEKAMRSLHGMAATVPCPALYVRPRPGG
jgi:WD40 repeat protein